MNVAAGQRAGHRQPPSYWLANQNAYNTLLGQGFNFGNQQALANAGFDQQAAWLINVMRSLAPPGEYSVGRA